MNIKQLIFNTLALTTSLLAINNPNPPTIYIANDGSGNFNCNGKSDQVEINKALDYVATHPNYTTVYLKSAKYVIDEPIVMPSNSILTGDSSTKLTLKDHVKWWTKDKPMITQKNRTKKWTHWGEKGKSISNVEIYGFGLSGGEQDEPKGKDYIPLIHFSYPYNISIHDMKMHHSYWDIVRLSSLDGVSIHSKVYNNIIQNSGHEGICFVGVTDFEAYNNKIYATRTNSGIRAQDTDNFSIHDNIIGNSLTRKSSGYAGILIENKYLALQGKAEIYNNLIYGKNGGIHLGSVRSGTNYPTGSRQNVHIHHNKIYKVKETRTAGDNLLLSGGIKIDGYHNTLIENNIIEGGTGDGIVYEGNSGGDKGYQTIVRNNKIFNNTGIAINNKNSLVHTFISSNNTLYANQGGNYHKVSSHKDIYQSTNMTVTNTFDQWYHITATYDNDTETFKIYINGQERNSKQFIGFGSIGTNNENLFLATYKGRKYWFKGEMDELSIWNRALNKHEINLIKDKGDNITKGLQAYFKMENSWKQSSLNQFKAELQRTLFTPNAKIGNYAALFDGIDDGVQFPTQLSTTQGLTIAIWIKRHPKGGEYQAILSKGIQSKNNHISLYLNNDNIIFELGNNHTRARIETSLNYLEDMSFTLK